MTAAEQRDAVPALPRAPDAIAALIAERGYVVLYRPHETNRCPGCAGAQWLVGRVTAECAHCHLALPLVTAPPAPLPDFKGE